MNKVILYISVIFLTIASFSPKISASASYPPAEISKHNTPADCWMIINENVYNLTDYLADHDRNLDIRSWCGTDATADYATKAGRGQSHSVRADSLLGEYLIGTLKASSDQPVSAPSPYNIYIPLLATIFLYFLSLKVFRRPVHNFIWNSLMVIGLIPSFGYGVIMVLAKQYPIFSQLKYTGMLYHHVEFSVAFGTACLLHFLLRLNVYLSQGKFTNLFSLRR
jgi:hypothetical protein